MKRLYFLHLLLLSCLGCYRNYEVDFPLQQSDLLGAWVLSSAPLVATNGFSSNIVSTALHLNRDGKAVYASFPIQERLDPGASKSRVDQWALSSGMGTWDLSDEGNGKRHIWQVRMQTEKMGVQLTVGREHSGDLILVYHPEANSNK